MQEENQYRDLEIEIERSMNMMEKMLKGCFQYKERKIPAFHFGVVALGFNRNRTRKLRKKEKKKRIDINKSLSEWGVSAQPFQILTYKKRMQMSSVIHTHTPRSQPKISKNCLIRNKE